MKTKEVDFKKLLGGIIGFILFTTTVELVPDNPNVTLTAGIAMLMAFWWVSEALPIGVTSLLPIVLFPILGVMDGKAISSSYINYVIFLFIGGFLMALALEKWGLHKRIALKILSVVGGSPFMILLGFMLSGAFLSMWMSNTATAMMMLPIAFSVITALETIHGEEKVNKFSTAILLGIAYSCSIGGIATLVGTPPNISFVRIFEIIFPNAPEISFGQWMTFAFPLSVVMFWIVLGIIYFMFRPKRSIKALDKSFFRQKYEELGPVTVEQKRVFVLFLMLIFLWIFRRPINLGFTTLPGWSTLFRVPKYLNDGTVAIIVSTFLFIVPNSKKTEGLITWQIFKKIPWDIVLLFGGGFALAKGFIKSGLSTYLGEQLSGLGEMGDFGLILSVTSLMTFLTEFTSNTATTEMMLPIISGLATEIKINPLLLMVPITLAASMAFMFPIATPPNAVVFGSGKLRMKDMVRAGFVINFIGITLIVILMLLWGTVIFDIDSSVFPEWATQAAENAKH